MCQPEGPEHVQWPSEVIGGDSLRYRVSVLRHRRFVSFGKASVAYIDGDDVAATASHRLRGGPIGRANQASASLRQTRTADIISKMGKGVEAQSVGSA